MRTPRTATLAAAALLALAPAGVLTVAAPAAQAASYSGSLLAAVKSLPVAAEVRTGYDRDLFTHWVDADSDGCDTRDEVLISEAVVKPTVGSGCSLSGGAWKSYYDGKKTTDPSTFDIDHMVPLAEAWDSGARTWTADTRKRFANDLKDARALVAVTAASNRSKSDQDPAEWLPAKGRCAYAAQWTATKIRWSLSVNKAEKRTLRGLAEACPAKKITVTKAKVVKEAAPPPSGGSGGTDGLDPKFGSCKDAKAAGYGPYYQGTDPEYAWYVDGDKDGIACE